MKKTLKKFSALFLTLAFIMTMLPTIAVAQTGPTHSIGSWRSNTRLSTYYFESHETVMRFTVSASANEPFAVRVSPAYSSEFDEYTVRVLNSSNNTISRAESHRTGASNQFRFLLARVDGSVGNAIYTVEVSRRNPGFVAGSTALKSGFEIHFEDRAPTKRGSEVITLSNVSNPGNPISNLNGTSSSIASVNLIARASIPDGAIVRQITTNSSISSNIGNTWHEVRHRPNATATWANWSRARVNNATSGTYNFTESNRIPAKSIWEFRYSTLAGASTTMSNIRLTIDYLYDPTLDYVRG
jgi:hypothetical protein